VALSVTAPSTTKAVIRHLSEDEGRVGDKVTIDGTGFGTPGVVRFGSTTAKVVSWKANKIVVIVPSIGMALRPAKSGHDRVRWYGHDREVMVTVTPNGGTASNGVEFELESGSRGHDSRGRS
jgi:hypothetical protein